LETGDEPSAVVPASGGEEFIRRVRLICAMAVSAVVFWYVGWRVVTPTDPGGPVTLLLVEQGIVAMAQLLGLAIVSSGLAVAICGARSANRGPMAIAVGLGALGLRGSQIDMLVLYRMPTPGIEQVAADPFPTTALIAETWLWLALIAVGFVVGRWVEGWFSPTGTQATEKRSAAYAADVRQSMAACVVASLVAWSILSFAIGTDAAPILKGQVYFGITLAFLVAGLIAQCFFETGSRVWSLVVVAIVASAAYLLGSPSQKDIAHAEAAGVYLNLSPMVRPLPLEWAALGALGALWERDWMHALRALFGLSAREES